LRASILRALGEFLWGRLPRFGERQPAQGSRALASVSPARTGPCFCFFRVSASPRFRKHAPFVAASPLLLVAFALNADAVDPNRAMSQYIRNRWGTEQGFPRGPVYAIGQSEDGYLWIGTQAGLVRFDGLNFQLIRDVPGLQNGESVLGLMPDRQGNLWIRMEGANLLHYHNGTWETNPLHGAALSRITAMCSTHQGEVLFSALEQGTLVYRQGKLEMIANARGLPRSPVLSLAQTPDGSIWAGTRGAGLFRLHDGQISSVSENLPDLKINTLESGAAGDLWIGTDHGIVQWNGNSISAPLPKSINQFQVLTMTRDRDGNIWAGTDSHGLLRINQSGVSYLDPSASFHGAVTALFEDREGNLWIGSANGIERLSDSAFVTYSLTEGLPTDGGKPLFVDNRNRTWFAPASGGLWWMSEDRHGHVSESGLDRDVVYSIAGSGEDLWLGRRRGGLTNLHAAGTSFTARTYTTADGLAQDNVFSVYEARDGAVWAGTLSGGVSRFRQGKFTNYTSKDGLLSNTVAAILEDAAGTMWFATPGGLNALANGHWQAYTETDGLPSENVYCLLEDSTGVLWVGTAGGLALRTAQGIHTPHGVPAPLHEPILGIAEDTQGSLWVATSTHVLRVDRRKLYEGTLEEGDLREYGMADGLRGTEGARRYRSVMADPRGRIWFSLNRGISVVDPVRLKRNTAPAIPQVQAISADGNSIPIRGTVHIPGGSRRIIFGFAGLSLAAPELVRFRYRLDGNDSAWSNASGTREAGYTNLGPHRYKFRVIASNPDGVWNGNEAAVDFQVDPLFWQTWYFRAAAVLLFVASILGFLRFRMRQLASRLNLRFEERLAERTRIAQELHDTLLQGFLSASMQVHVATDSLPADSKAKPTLTRALQLMRQVIDEGRDAVRGLRSTGSASLDLEQAFSLVQQEYVVRAKTGGQIGFQVVVEGQQKPLHPLLRDEVYRIGREALLNAFRHSRAKRIEVEIKYSPNHLRVLVRDDGCGIEPEVVKSGREGHFGLVGMRERAEQIGARLRVFTNAGVGTEIILSVPGHVAFQQHSGKKRPWFSRRNSSTAAVGEESAPAREIHK